MKRALLGAVLISAACCGPKSGGVNPNPQLTGETVVAELAKGREALTSFRGESKMDYWVSGQRLRGDVLVMGKLGKFVRFAALSPAGGSTIVEMACDGTNFVYLNYQENCALTGPCDASSVGMFFGIPLEPDDFLHLALGTTPVIANPTSTITWDGSAKLHRVELKASEGTQKIAINVAPMHWDVHASELLGSDGKVRWSVANTDFRKVTGSGERRVPEKTRFKSSVQNQDLLVEWGGEFEVNAQLPTQNFTIQVPSGLSTCGQKAPKPAAPPAKAPAPTK
ncbi:MAG TPA: DUF4292 domain-containing protein [Kofleriaceae bacterium]